MSGDNGKRNRTRPVEWVIVALTILNLLAVIYLARENYVQQKDLEAFKTSLSTANLRLYYEEKAAVVRVFNISKVRAENIRIEIQVPIRFDVRELVGQFFTVDRQNAITGDRRVVEYTIQQGLLPGEWFGFDVYGENQSQEDPQPSEVYVMVTCSNCAEILRWP